ncbi:MAG: hypothetical protein HZB53_19000 [Chloroflexi bacterium]|nr:hypothetical protein [Chloroflexota bacterium]
MTDILWMVDEDKRREICPTREDSMHALPRRRSVISRLGGFVVAAVLAVIVVPCTCY